jgi:hypothetical protein
VENFEGIAGGPQLEKEVRRKDKRIRIASPGGPKDKDQQNPGGPKNK